MGAKGRTRPTVDTQAFVSSSPESFAESKTRPKKVRNNAVLMKPLNGVKGLSNSRNTSNNSRQERTLVGLPTPRRKDCSKLLPFDIATQLKKRGLVPTGFMTDDAKVLQAIFDKEYEENMAKREEILWNLNKEKKEQQSRERALRKFQREGFEEERAFKKSPEFANWLTRLAQGESVATSSSLNGRRPEYVRCLLKKLPVSSSLKTLEMRSSRITDELAIALGGVIASNRSIRTLQLGDNLIGSEGLRYIAQGLQVNDVLVCLGLDRNPLTVDFRMGDDHCDKGISALCDTLKTNGTLRFVTVRNTGLNKDIATLLATSVSLQNVGLLMLSMDTTILDYNIAEMLADRLRSNKGRREDARAKQRQLKLQQNKEKQRQDAIEAKVQENQRAREWAESTRVQRVKARFQELNARRIQEEEDEAKAAAEAQAEAERLAAAAAKKGKKRKGRKKRKGKKKKKKK